MHLKHPGDILGAVLFLVITMWAPTLYAQPESGVVRVNGIDFEYFIEGTGWTCLVIPGSLTEYRALSPQLKDHFRFVFLASRMITPEEQVGDVPGMTMDTLVADIEQARQALGLGQICVLGHSIAGILALEYARQHPQYATHVIMHSTPPFWDERYGPPVAAYWEANASPERKNLLEANWSQISADSLSNLPPSEAAILEYITNAPRLFHDLSYDLSWLLEDVYWNQAAWNQLFGVIMANYDLADGPPIETPVFLANGRDDFAVPYTLWESERAKIPNLTYHLFDRSGHYPMLEEADRFDRLLLDWIERE